MSVVRIERVSNVPVKGTDNKANDAGQNSRTVTCY